jgi:hypothetical protein
MISRHPGGHGAAFGAGRSRIVAASSGEANEGYVGEAEEGGEVGPVLFL